MSKIVFIAMYKKCQSTFYLGIVIGVILISLPFRLKAQDNTNYRIQLHARTFTPIENIETISKSEDLFTKSFFKKKNYVVIQFKQLPTQEQKQDLETKGIKLFEYIPSNAYTASVLSDIKMDELKSSLFRSIFYFLPADKTVPTIINGNDIPAYAIQESGMVDLNVITYETIEAAEIVAELQTIGAKIIGDMPMFQSFVIRVPQNNMKDLVALPFVQWAEFVDAPNKLENTLGRTLHRVAPLNDGIRNLKGDSVNIGIWDGGAIGSHVDFSPVGRVTQVEASTTSTHSTHCSGTILGRGILNPNARGMASNASLFSYNFNGNIQTEMAVGIPANNLIVSSHSYGSTQTCGLNGSGVTYSSTSRNSDLNLNTYPFHIHCHSAGNSQTSCTGGWSTITASGKSAKNNILVASIATDEVLSYFSSCGPVQDGRVKPEISALGSSVLSTYPNDAYATISGTSMATPGIAGSATLLVQRYKQLNANALPPSSLIKNIILNTAQDLGNPGPDYRYGYGRINALEAVKILEESRYVIGAITTGNTNNVNITVPSGAAKLCVMLTWNDPAGAANANPALVNNLNLSVINGATTTLPWILDPNNPGSNATRGVDIVSNIEQVTLDNPTAGTYTLRVNGLSVPTGPSQEYSLTWSVEMPYIEVIYPNGNERFDPSATETITWNSAGVTTNQTIQYSLNNGASWSTLSSTISPTTTRYSWNVPTANTAAALIRITSGSITDESDATFKILGAPTGFSGNNSPTCNAGELNFSWSASTSATHYDLFKLNATTGFFETIASNILGTSYTATGLPANTTIWFTIVAKNNTSGAESPRALAIKLTTSSSGTGPATPGAISGPTNLCGPTSGVVYSVSPVGGATGYIWTVPAGAFVTGGSGTNSITVNFTSIGTGNLNVSSTDGVCTSNPSSISVVVNALPIVMANATNTILCAGNSLTLTGSGANTYTWNNSVTNGISFTPTATANYIVTGTDANGCTSTSNITVVVNTLPAVGINASATSICAGNMVALSGTGASTYSWNNGVSNGVAFAPAATNTYIVIGTDGNGCSATSSVTVTVDPAPAAPTVSVTNPVCDTAKGTINISAPIGASLEYSINGTNYQSSTHFINVATGNYNVTARATTATTCVSAPTAITINSSTTPCVSNVTVGVQNLNPSIAEGGTSNLNFFINNVGTIPTAGAINIIISKPTNGALTFSLPTGWIITSNTAGSTFLQSSNIIQPGLINRVTIGGTYVHDNTNEDAVKSSNIKAQGGSGSESITNDNEGQTFLQIN